MRYTGPLIILLLCVCAGCASKPPTAAETKASIGSLSLLEAAAEDNVPAARAALQGGADVNETDSTGRTPLILAAENGSTEMVSLLLKAGADVHVRCDGAGFEAATPLMLALALHHDEAAMLIARAGSEVNAQANVRGVDGYTPLMIAARQGSLEPARVLVSLGADVNSASSDGMTVLMYAVSNNLRSEREYELVSFLLDSGADVGARTVMDAENGMVSEGVNALMIAAMADKADLITLLVERGADTEERARMPGVGEASPLIFAAASGRERSLKALIASGANVNSAALNGRTALIFAAASGNNEMVSALLGAGANVNARDSRGRTALTHAKNEEVRRLIRAAGGRV